MSVCFTLRCVTFRSTSTGLPAPVRKLVQTEVRERREPVSRAWLLGYNCRVPRTRDLGGRGPARPPPARRPHLPRPRRQRPLPPSPRPGPDPTPAPRASRPAPAPPPRPGRAACGQGRGRAGASRGGAGGAESTGAPPDPRRQAEPHLPTPYFSSSVGVHMAGPGAAPRARRPGDSAAGTAAGPAVAHREPRRGRSGGAGQRVAHRSQAAREAAAAATSAPRGSAGDRVVPGGVGEGSPPVRRLRSRAAARPLTAALPGSGSGSGAAAGLVGSPRRARLPRMRRSRAGARAA